MKQLVLFPDLHVPERKAEIPKDLPYHDRRTFSLRDLLGEFNINLTPRRVNDILVARGVLEELERVSSKGEVKKYKSITENYQKFGRNESHPMSPNQTQPRYYREEFEDLLGVFDIKST